MARHSNPVTYLLRPNFPSTLKRTNYTSTGWKNYKMIQSKLLSSGNTLYLGRLKAHGCTRQVFAQAMDHSWFARLNKLFRVLSITKLWGSQSVKSRQRTRQNPYSNWWWWIRACWKMTLQSEKISSLHLDLDTKILWQQFWRWMTLQETSLFRKFSFQRRPRRQFKNQLTGHKFTAGFLARTTLNSL